MCELHFYCPTHDRDIASGMDLDEDTLRRNRLSLTHVPCPWCGKMHRFLLADATVDGRKSEVLKAS